MKAENKTTAHNRTIRFTELPISEDGDLSELEVKVCYTGESEVFKAVTLDKVVIPAILEAVNTKPAVSLEDVKILVIGDRVWGIGDTLKEALQNMRKNGKGSKYIVYLAAPGTKLYEDGSWSFPNGQRPREIHRVGC